MNFSHLTAFGVVLSFTSFQAVPAPIEPSQITAGLAQLSRSTTPSDPALVEKALKLSLRKVERGDAKADIPASVFDRSSVFVPAEAEVGVRWISTNFSMTRAPSLQIALTPQVCVLPDELEKALGNRATNIPPPPHYHGGQTSALVLNEFLPQSDWVISVAHSSSAPVPGFAIAVTRAVVVRFHVGDVGSCISYVNLEYQDILSSAEPSR